MRAALRHPVDRPGVANRTDWRAVAKRTGVVRVWKDGQRERVALEFWLAGKRRLIYADISRWGDREPLTRESAGHLLSLIRAQIESQRSIESALAPFLGSMAPENLIAARWKAYVEQKTREARDGRITARHLRELRGIAKRGYLAYLLDRSIFELDFGLLEDWLGWLGETKAHLSPKTRKHALTAIVAFARWLHRRREIAHVPEVPELRVPQHSPALLSEGTQDLILAAIPEPARGVFLAMGLMGLRLGEARGMDARAYRDGVLTIDSASKDQRAEGEIGSTKTGTVRRLPVAREVAEWIEKYTAKRARLEGGPMFTNPRGHTKSKRWSPSAMDRTWARASLAVLGYITPLYEGTRHSFATQALARGAAHRHVQSQLGHADPKTTELYAKLAEGATLSVLRPGSRIVSKASPGSSGES